MPMTERFLPKFFPKSKNLNLLLWMVFSKYVLMQREPSSEKQENQGNTISLRKCFQGVKLLLKKGGDEQTALWLMRKDKGGVG